MEIWQPANLSQLCSVTYVIYRQSLTVHSIECVTQKIIQEATEDICYIWYSHRCALDVQFSHRCEISRFFHSHHILKVYNIVNNECVNEKPLTFWPAYFILLTCATDENMTLPHHLQSTPQTHTHTSKFNPCLQLSTLWNNCSVWARESKRKRGMSNGCTALSHINLIQRH